MTQHIHREEDTMTSPITRFACFTGAVLFLLGAGPAPSPGSDVKMRTLDPAGGAALGRVEDVRALDGASLDAAVRRAQANPAYSKARLELTVTHDLHESAAEALAFIGRASKDQEEIEVVLIPFTGKGESSKREGLIAVATSGKASAVFCCILERAVKPSEPGAVDLEVPGGGPGGMRLWLLTAGEGIAGDEPDSRSKKYFTCLFNRSLEGCAACASTCMRAPLSYARCLGLCCAAAAGHAAISCAVEIMFA